MADAAAGDRVTVGLAAAWAAEAEVPKNGEYSGTDVVTPSAAARVGFRRTRPPVALRSPGVSGLPVGEKKIRRGPSEVNRSDRCPLRKRPGKGPDGLGGSPSSRSNGNGVPAGTAATLTAARTVECPRVTPGVA